MGSKAASDAAAAGWERWRGVVLAAVGGYLDTLGFIMLGGLFVNHVTGNIVLAAAEPGRSSLPEIVMFPVFFLMVLAGTAVAAWGERRRRSLGVPAALAVEACFLLLFLLLGLALIPVREAPGIGAEIIVGAAGVSAMAIQTAATRLAGHIFPTNMVTGTMTMLGMDAARLLFHPPPAGPERSATVGRAREHARVVGGFATGAALAAVVTTHVQFWAATLPLAVIAWCARRELAGATSTQPSCNFWLLERRSSGKPRSTPQEEGNMSLARRSIRRPPSPSTSRIATMATVAAMALVGGACEGKPSAAGTRMLVRRDPDYMAWEGFDATVASH